MDTFIEDGARVVPFYDSMIAKVIAHGGSRQAALERMRAALLEVRIEGVPTNRDLHLAVLGHPAFARGGVDTNFLAGLIETMQRDRN